ncbi:hypothetical protein JCM10296v2_004738 [Rhodotorula toruloides]
MHLSILLSLVTTALPLAFVDAAPAPAADVASTDSYHDDAHCGGGGGYGVKVDNWGRCGGKGYKGSTECEDGFYCKSWNAWYSQCMEKPHPYPPPPQTTTPTTTWAPYPTFVPGGGFTCVKGYCKKDHKTSTSTSYKTTTTSKTPYPTHKPQCWSDKQCSYGEVCEYGYCVKDHKTSTTTSTTTSKPYPTHKPQLVRRDLLRGLLQEGPEDDDQLLDLDHFERRLPSLHLHHLARRLPDRLPSTAPASGQCGGKGWHGPTTCGAGYVCKYQNVGWSMCEPKH